MSEKDESRAFEVNHRLVLGLAVPMMLAYLSTPILGIVDTAVAGRLDDPAILGGLAVGAVLIDLIFTTFNFLRAGTTGLTAQAMGQGDKQEIKAMLLRAVMLGIACGLAAIVLAPMVLGVGLFFVETTEAVAAATSTYFVIRIFASPFALANFALLGWLIGLGKSGIGLGLHLLLSISNIVLSILLGVHFGWGLEGIAIATVCAEAITFIVGSLICYNESRSGDAISWKRVFDTGRLKKFASLNFDIMIRSFALLFAFAFFTAQGAKFGETTLAANAVLIQLFFVAGYFLDGQAVAAEQLVGRSIGANYATGFRRSVALSSVWNLILAFGLSAIFWIFGTVIVNILTTNEAVRLEAYQYLIWTAIIPLAGVLAFQMDGVFIGAAWSRDMSAMMLVSLVGYLLIWWVTKDAHGNHGLWFSLNCFLIIRGITLLLRLPVRYRENFS